MGAYIEGRVEEIKEERPRLYRGWRGSEKMGRRTQEARHAHTPTHSPIPRHGRGGGRLSMLELFLLAGLLEALWLQPIKPCPGN